MDFFHPPAFFRLFDKKHLITELNRDQKIIGLTFDDGPIPEVTPEVLGILEKRHAKATFFMVGNNVAKHPEIYRMIIEQGHSVGNHTWNHLNGWKTPAGEYVGNILRCNDYFTTGLFRPPYGRFTPAQYYLLRKSFRFVLWSVLSHDYSPNTTPEQCLRNVIKYSRNGSIVVFHDSIKAKDKILFALPRFIDAFMEMGYEFRGIPV